MITAKMSNSRRRHVPMFPASCARLLLLLLSLLPLLAASPLPQLAIVRSQHMLLNAPRHHGRQIDLSGVTDEVFWLNLEEGYFACQQNASTRQLRLFRLSRLCNGVADCYRGADEMRHLLGCSDSCSPPCGVQGVCLESGPSAARPQCHCHDGFGGKACEQRDVNECRLLRPCSVFAHCTNTLGSFRCTCRAGYEGDGIRCKRRDEGWWEQQNTNQNHNLSDVDAGSEDESGAVASQSDEEKTELRSDAVINDKGDPSSNEVRTMISEDSGMLPFPLLGRTSEEEYDYPVTNEIDFTSGSSVVSLKEQPDNAKEKAQGRVEEEQSSSYSSSEQDLYGGIGTASSAVLGPGYRQTTEKSTPSLTVDEDDPQVAPDSQDGVKPFHVSDLPSSFYPSATDDSEMVPGTFDYDHGEGHNVDGTDKGTEAAIHFPSQVSVETPTEIKEIVNSVPTSETATTLSVTMTSPTTTTEGKAPGRTESLATITQEVVAEEHEGDGNFMKDWVTNFSSSEAPTTQPHVTEASTTVTISPAMSGAAAATSTTATHGEVSATSKPASQSFSSERPEASTSASSASKSTRTSTTAAAFSPTATIFSSYDESTAGKVESMSPPFSFSGISPSATSPNFATTVAPTTLGSSSTSSLDEISANGKDSTSGGGTTSTTRADTVTTTASTAKMAVTTSSATTTLLHIQSAEVPSENALDSTSKGDETSTFTTEVTTDGATTHAPRTTTGNTAALDFGSSSESDVVNTLNDIVVEILEDVSIGETTADVTNGTESAPITVPPTEIKTSTASVVTSSSTTSSVDTQSIKMLSKDTLDNTLIGSEFTAEATATTDNVAMTTPLTTNSTTSVIPGEKGTAATTARSASATETTPAGTTLTSSTTLTSKQPATTESVVTATSAPFAAQGMRTEPLATKKPISDTFIVSASPASVTGTGEPTTTTITTTITTATTTERTKITTTMTSAATPKTTKPTTATVTTTTISTTTPMSTMATSTTVMTTTATTRTVTTTETMTTTPKVTSGSTTVMTQTTTTASATMKMTSESTTAKMPTEPTASTMKAASTTKSTTTATTNSTTPASSVMSKSSTMPVITTSTKSTTVSVLPSETEDVQDDTDATMDTHFGSVEIIRNESDDAAISPLEYDVKSNMVEDGPHLEIGDHETKVNIYKDGSQLNEEDSASGAKDQIQVPEVSQSKESQEDKGSILENSQSAGDTDSGVKSEIVLSDYDEEVPKTDGETMGIGHAGASGDKKGLQGSPEDSIHTSSNGSSSTEDKNSSFGPNFPGFGTSNTRNIGEGNDYTPLDESRKSEGDAMDDQIVAAKEFINSDANVVKGPADVQHSQNAAPTSSHHLTSGFESADVAHPIAGHSSENKDQKSALDETLEDSDEAMDATKSAIDIEIHGVDLNDTKKRLDTIGGSSATDGGTKTNLGSEATGGKIASVLEVNSYSANIKFPEHDEEGIARDNHHSNPQGSSNAHRDTSDSHQHDDAKAYTESISESTNEYSYSDSQGIPNLSDEAHVHSGTVPSGQSPGADSETENAVNRNKIDLQDLQNAGEVVQDHGVSDEENVQSSDGKEDEDTTSVNEDRVSATPETKDAIVAQGGTGAHDGSADRHVPQYHEVEDSSFVAEEERIQSSTVEDPSLSSKETSDESSHHSIDMSPYGQQQTKVVTAGTESVLKQGASSFVRSKLGELEEIENSEPPHTDYESTVGHGVSGEDDNDKSVATKYSSSTSSLEQDHFVQAEESESQHNDHDTIIGFSDVVEGKEAEQDNSSSPHLEQNDLEGTENSMPKHNFVMGDQGEDVQDEIRMAEQDSSSSPHLEQDDPGQTGKLEPQHNDDYVSFDFSEAPEVEESAAQQNRSSSTGLGQHDFADPEKSGPERDDYDVLLDKSADAEDGKSAAKTVNSFSAVLNGGQLLLPGKSEPQQSDNDVIGFTDIVEGKESEAEQDYSSHSHLDQQDLQQIGKSEPQHDDDNVIGLGEVEGKESEAEQGSSSSLGLEQHDFVEPEISGPEHFGEVVEDTESEVKQDISSSPHLEQDDLGQKGKSEHQHSDKNVISFTDIVEGKESEAEQDYSSHPHLDQQDLQQIGKSEPQHDDDNVIGLSEVEGKESEAEQGSSSSLGLEQHDFVEPEISGPEHFGEVVEDTESEVKQDISSSPHLEQDDLGQTGKSEHQHSDKNVISFTDIVEGKESEAEEDYSSHPHLDQQDLQQIGKSEPQHDDDNVIGLSEVEGKESEAEQGSSFSLGLEQHDPEVTENSKRKDNNVLADGDDFQNEMSVAEQDSKSYPHLEQDDLIQPEKPEPQSTENNVILDPGEEIEDGRSKVKNVNNFEHLEFPSYPDVLPDDDMRVVEQDTSSFHRLEQDDLFLQAGKSEPQHTNSDASIDFSELVEGEEIVAEQDGNFSTGLEEHDLGEKENLKSKHDSDIADHGEDAEEEKSVVKSDNTAEDEDFTSYPQDANSKPKIKGHNAPVEPGAGDLLASDFGTQANAQFGGRHDEDVSAGYILTPEGNSGFNSKDSSNTPERAQPGQLHVPSLDLDHSSTSTESLGFGTIVTSPPTFPTVTTSSSITTVTATTISTSVPEGYDNENSRVDDGQNPFSYSANIPSQSVIQALQPCSEEYLGCRADPQTCRDRFDDCSAAQLGEDHSLQTDLSENEVAHSELPNSLLECILTHQECIVPNKKLCMAEFQHCALSALEASRLKRLEENNNDDITKDTTAEVEKDTEIEAITGGDEDVFHEVLAMNFTHCVSLYTSCIAYGDPQCKDSFDACSLALLFDSRLNETEAAFLSETALDTVDSEDRTLATELYECIRDHMMCLMAGETGRSCMGDYQTCSLVAMDRAKTARPSPEGPVIVRPGVMVGKPEEDMYPRPEIGVHSPEDASVLQQRPPVFVPEDQVVARPREGSLGTRTASTASLVQSATLAPGYLILQQLDESTRPECEDIGAPVTFGSFNGKPAKNIADCSWDFFSCTRRYGTWPANKPCCQARFDACCMYVMGKKKKPVTTTEKPQEPSGSYQPQQPQPDNQGSSLRPPVDGEGNRVELIDCIWGYMGCTKRGKKSDQECKAIFNDCSMIAMGMGPPTSTTTKKPINDIDIPEDLPDFLRPVDRPDPKPIQDIDLPEEMEHLQVGGGTFNEDREEDLALNHPEGHESNEFLNCLLRLYRCQETRASFCPNVERCRPEQDGPKTEAVVSDEVGGAGDPAFSAELGQGQLIEAQDGGSTDINVDCRWAYLTCGRTRTQSECRAHYRKCTGGGNLDNEICADVAQNPQNYLVPHPEDCTKFFSCQSLGPQKGWIAHLMDCPESTGFDTRLRICNFIRALPRCRKDDARLLRAYQDISSISARQTKAEREHVNVADIAYLTAPDAAENSSPRSIRAHQYIFLLLVPLAITLCGQLW